MTENWRPEFNALTLPLQNQVDEICDRFESSWRHGEFPSIDAYVDAIDVSARPALFRELLELELELRLEKGEQPTVEEYRRNFPEWSREVAAAFQPDRDSGLIRSTYRRHDDDFEVRDPGQTIETLPWDPAGQKPLPAIDEYFGREIGGYVILNLLGKGGMGAVYRARQREVGRVVALKIIKKTARNRFPDEVQSMAQLDHPNIVPIYEVGRTPDTLYFSMRYIEGRSLSELVASEKIKPRRAAKIVQAIARAIEHAHQHGILHRDVKPSNVMLDAQDHPYVVDFGLAHGFDPGRTISESGQPVGTPAFMSPEQVRGDGKINYASDVYNIGATLYALLSGRPPFGGADLMAMMRFVLVTTPVALRRRDPSIPRDLEMICAKCLEKDPAQRYQSAADLADALGKFLNHETVPDTRPWLAVRAARWVRREPWRGLAAGIAVVTVVISGVLGTMNVRQRQAQADRLVHELWTVNDVADVPRIVKALDEDRWWTRPRLRELVRTHSDNPATRARIALALLSDDPDQAIALADRLLVCGPHEHQVLREALSGQGDAVAARLAVALDDSDRDLTQKTRAAAALLATEEADRLRSEAVVKAWQRLRRSNRPEARAALLDWLVRSEVKPDRLIRRLKNETDVSARRVLLQCLGALGDGAPPSGVPPDWIAGLAVQYRDDPDPGIHSSLSYLMRRWGLGEQVDATDGVLAVTARGPRAWFVNSARQTFACLNGLGPDDPSPPLPVRTAIMTTEVTLGQYLEFNPNHFRRRAKMRVLPAAHPDAPADVISYYDAAKYCRWLSEREFLPESEMCYPPVAEIGLEMRLPDDFLTRKGYRLPTVAEWETAARAGTLSDRYCGDSDAVLDDYAWQKRNNPGYPERVGLLLPNDYGLFDVLGNVAEWCYNPDPKHFLDCTCLVCQHHLDERWLQSELRGGSFPSLAFGVSARERKPGGFVNNPNIALPYSGFRIVKAVP